MSMIDEEPFFARLRVLAHDVMWPESSLDDIEVEAQGGEVYHITYRCPDQLEDDYARVETCYELTTNAILMLEAKAASLYFFNQRLPPPRDIYAPTIPVPALHAYDPLGVSTSFLGTKYILRSFCPGINLKAAWINLNVQQREGVAIQLASFYRRLMAMAEGFNQPGWLTYEPQVGDGPSFVVKPFYARQIHSNRVNSGSLAYRFLANNLLHLTSSYANGGSEEDRRLSQCFSDLCDVVREMEECGLFRDVGFTLVDEALGPSSMLIGGPDASVVDYEPSPEAYMAPDFVACRPPTWLWDGDEMLQAWQPYPPQELEQAREDPPAERDSDQSRELMRVFGHAVGDAFIRLAYRPEYRLARIIAWVAIKSKDKHNDRTPHLEYDPVAEGGLEMMTRWPRLWAGIKSEL